MALKTQMSQLGQPLPFLVWACRARSPCPPSPKSAHPSLHLPPWPARLCSQHNPQPAESPPGPKGPELGEARSPTHLPACI